MEAPISIKLIPAPHILTQTTLQNHQVCSSNIVIIITPQASPPLLTSPAFTEPKDDIVEVANNRASQSFSNVVLECRSISEANPHRRPASLDLNDSHSIDAAIQSPRFLMGGVRTAQKVSISAATSRSRSGVYPSPGTPGYWSGVNGSSVLHEAILKGNKGMKFHARDDWLKFLLVVSNASVLTTSNWFYQGSSD